MTTETKDRDRMDWVTQSLPTKAAKIRALNAEGFSRADIARYLGIRYQHVRNVLLQASATASKDSASRVTSEPNAPAPRAGRARLDADGGVALPRAVFDELGIAPGSIVPWRLQGDEVILMSPSAGIRFARSVLGDPGPSGESWVDLLHEERRREAEAEDLRGA